MYSFEHAFFYAGTDPEVGGAGVSLRYRFDVRSMRKIKPRETLAFIVQYLNVTGNPPLTFSFGGARVLQAGI